jgi:hypothetical protein
MWSACEGAVAPKASDDCTNNLDTNCDGTISCECNPAHSPIPCGECGEGQRACNAGTWGECMGAKGPKVVYYPDADKDGYGDPSKPTPRCDGAPAGHTAKAGDCCDVDAYAYPGAPPRREPSAPGCALPGDFDCDGVARILDSTQIASCPIVGVARSYFAIPLCTSRSGWEGEVPSCGTPGLFVECEPDGDTTRAAALCVGYSSKLMPTCQ